MDSDSEDIQCTPPDIVEAAQITSLKLLPEKSKKRYLYCYDQFLEWRRKKQVKTSFSENVLLAYMNELAQKIAPSTLWSHYSMLRTTLYANHSLDISKYLKLKAFLKRTSAGYQPKKSKTLSPKQVNDFITRAPDEKYLLAKVVLIMGISGACRKHELIQLTVDDIEDVGSASVIHINNTKNNVPRKFTITGEFYNIYKKYVSIRPPTDQKRFFLNYQKGKCTQQVVGINKVGSIPKIVATFLNLKNPELYTGHSFRRTSATILVDAGGDITTLKRHGGWKSSTVAEGYIDNSLTQRLNVSNKIMNAVSETSEPSSKPSCSYRVSAPSSPLLTSSFASDSTTNELLVKELPVIRSQLPSHTTTAPSHTNNKVLNTVTSTVTQAFTDSHNLNQTHDALVQTPLQFTGCYNNHFVFNFYNSSTNNKNE